MDELINHKIALAFERISKTFKVLLWEESKKYNISPIQIQILIFCLTHKEKMLKVTSLSKEFDLTKATISDSVRVLLKKELLIKVPDIYDSRSYALRLTKKGNDIAVKTSTFTKPMEASIGILDDYDKGVFLKNLLNVINQLNKKSIISVQRMCLTCNHYSKDNNINYCKLLDKKLTDHELQVDCFDHKIII